MRVAAERIMTAIETCVPEAAGGETIIRPDGSVRVITDDATVSAAEAGWWIAGLPEVRSAIRIRRDTWTYNANPVYGVLLTGDGMLLLNERATMNDLGRRLGDDLDPWAYAEVLAELWSGDRVDEPVSTALAADFAWPSGELFVDTGVYPDPAVDRDGDELRIDFHSGRGFIPRDAAAGYHVYRWRITARPGRTPVWDREHLGFDGPGS